jgi:hypothetical protein
MINSLPERPFKQFALLIYQIQTPEDAAVNAAAATAPTPAPTPAESAEVPANATTATNDPTPSPLPPSPPPSFLRSYLHYLRTDPQARLCTFLYFIILLKILMSAI